MTFRFTPQRAVFLSMAGIALLLAPGMARAGSNYGARFLVHLTAPGAKNPCTLRNDPPYCHEVDTSGQIGSGYFAFVLVSGIKDRERALC